MLRMKKQVSIVFQNERRLKLTEIFIFAEEIISFIMNCNLMMCKDFKLTMYDEWVHIKENVIKNILYSLHYLSTLFRRSKCIIFSGRSFFSAIHNNRTKCLQGLWILPLSYIDLSCLINNNICFFAKTEPYALPVDLPTSHFSKHDTCTTKRSSALVFSEIFIDQNFASCTCEM